MCSCVLCVCACVNARVCMHVCMRMPSARVYNIIGMFARAHASIHTCTLYYIHAQFRCVCACTSQLRAYLSVFFRMTRCAFEVPFEI